MLWRSIGSLRLFQGVRSFSSAVESPSMKQTSWTRRVLLALGVSTIGSGAYVLSREDSYDINTYLGITQRYTRIGWTMLKISGAYQYALWSNQHADQYLFDAEIRKVHLYAARCLLDMCLANKGMFIKAGQYIASQTLLLPAEYTDTLALLQDKVPSRPWSEIEVTLQKEFGNNYMSTRFESIEQKPIAAGSLAQVHRGFTKDGREVAIKIQYEDVKASFSTDMKFIETVVTFYSKMFPQFNFQWLLNEFEADIPQEINFVKEGENAERLIKLFQKDPRLKIPEIYWEHTTERVLTMEFIGGNVCKLVDKDSFKKMGFSEKQVCEVLVDVFCTQAFEHGFVHADPHPGNILVRPRKDKPTEPQLVLLDHGLYRTMDDEFRIDYCTLWKSLILRDQETAIRICNKFGILEYFKVFTVMITGRDYDEYVESQTRLWAV
eukprot:TRINITY_DN6172_c0_g1_i4.p1 TRINITY_DN6172_c0_g1~~TRINITY_DN6172_c0_g1_i4.p1  ORF type:complete len:436 (+),score=66.62 TRINITY_DN6172_c0_g1_i4:49-1356(+)